jgi:hypothetical protein
MSSRGVSDDAHDSFNRTRHCIILVIDATGTRLGAYEITNLIGAGGLGESAS